MNYKNDTAPGSVSSATYADLPGPELKGESMAEAAIPRLDRASIQIKNLLFVFSGNGTTEKHPVTKKITLLKWSILGKLPFGVKTTLVGFWNGWPYFTSGQRDKGPDNPQPKKVIGELWRTKLKLNS
ncbi:hypothetical protein ACFX15_023942 [Malus domestica]